MGPYKLLEVEPVRSEATQKASTAFKHAFSASSVPTFGHDQTKLVQAPSGHLTWCEVAREYLRGPWRIPFSFGGDFKALITGRS